MFPGVAIENVGEYVQGSLQILLEGNFVKWFQFLTDVHLN